MLDESDGNAYAEMGNLSQRVGELFTGLVATIDSLNRRTKRLEIQGQELEERLAVLLEQRTDGRSDLHDESHIAHVGLAAEYRSLIMQWMQRVARKTVGTGHRSNLEYELGCQVARFSDHLFRESLPDTEGLLQSLGEIDAEIRQLAETMCFRASNLREKIALVDISHEWDFRTEISGILDDERQDAWLTCDPQLPVCLIVAPAYLVQGHLYAKQLVVTGTKAGPSKRDRATRSK